MTIAWRITVSKETYYSVKRDLLQCQKRPITVSKETYYSVKETAREDMTIAWRSARDAIIQSLGFS